MKLVILKTKVIDPQNSQLPSSFTMFYSHLCFEGISFVPAYGGATLQ